MSALARATLPSRRRLLSCSRPCTNGIAGAFVGSYGSSASIPSTPLYRPSSRISSTKDHYFTETRRNHCGLGNRSQCSIYHDHEHQRHRKQRHSSIPIRQLNNPPLSQASNYFSYMPNHPQHHLPTGLYQHYFSTVPNNDSDSDSDSDNDTPSNSSSSSSPPHASHPCHPRLLSLRNVGIFAHVDAGKTTVTERMLALSGIVREAGSVDDGDTVTDYLPAERERGITIQSAAVGFDWVVPSSSKKEGVPTTRVAINLIDTPGHVDFSVEVHRSVAVLDGAVLVVDAVAGVQAQTETVWRAIRNTDRRIGAATNNNENDSSNDNHNTSKNPSSAHGSHAHEPLPALLFINKMDREGADFRHAIDTVRRKLRGSRPLPIQLPLYRVERHGTSTTTDSKGSASSALGPEIVAGSLTESPPHGEFIGLIDLIHMRAIVYPPNAESLRMEDAVPNVIPLQQQNDPSSSSIVEAAMEGRRELISHLAEVDDIMEDLYLHAMMEEEEGNGDSCPVLTNISTEEIQSSLRRSTLSRRVMPTLCGAALRGVGVEPVLDCVAEYLPCPLDRLPPQLQLLGSSNTKSKKQQQNEKMEEDDDRDKIPITLGHPLHPSTLAYVFKVLHMKGRGGSGDGRVAFARVYSGTLKARDSVRIISPSSMNSVTDGEGKNGRKTKYPVSKIGGMLELSGGKFDNLPEGSCPSGDVCALVGLKGVVTGDTLLAMAASNDTANNSKRKKKKNDLHWKQYTDGVHLAGLASPKPVLTVRVEAASSSEQSRLSAALALLAVEDPSLVVEETPTSTLISGLGELHVEVVLDRLQREYGLEVRTGRPAVTYKEALLLEDGEEMIETDGMVEYDRTVGGVRLQGAVRLQLSRSAAQSSSAGQDLCIPPEDPTVTLSPEARAYFNLGSDASSSPDESEHKYPPSLRALLSGARGSLKRGRLGPHSLANCECHILEVDSELSGSDASFPGAMRAAAANAVTSLLESLVRDDRIVILEPKMNVEISVPTEKVGDVLSDLTGRRGAVDDVAMAEEGGHGGGDHGKAMVQAEVPLIEILGYANSLRSLTGGEGSFSAEYKGHAPQDGL